MIVREGTSQDATRALVIWRLAVDATHGFLSPADRRSIDAKVSGFLPAAPLWIAECEGEGAGFMVLDGDKIEALFVDPARHGRGVGTALVDHARSIAPCVKVDANEQADNAVPFYVARGFERIGRSDNDEQGRPYPIVHFRYPGID
ncbi:acetyltransferase [Erythrobacter westpacificensis]|uniref:Acetyltransferase n=1 Tax=Erythrobacter westpacificensis TaxID=1055231 RepID=A0ABP9KGA7_9SPHN